MKTHSIKQLSFLGFLIVFFIFILSGVSIFYLSDKYEKINHKYYVLESAYHNMLEYKYFTERLLTTQNLKEETKLWIVSKNKFKTSFNLLFEKKYLMNQSLTDFYNVIEDESNKIIKQFQNKLFKEKNVMEKSILRRLGEGLNSNETSDYYLAITELKNSIDYLKQYEEFLLDDIGSLVNKQKAILDEKRVQTKLIAFITFLTILVLGGIIVFAILKLIVNTETKLINTKTKLEETNSKLTIQQNELESIFDNIPSMIFLKDVKELRFTRVNKAGEVLLGVSENELLGKNDYDFFPRDEADFFTMKDRETIQNDMMIDIKEEPILTSKGERVLHTRKVVVKDEKGEPVYLLGISEDITDRKEKERIILEQSKNAAMGEMIGNIAHQWRQPLSVISTGATGMLMQKQFDQLSDELFEKTCNTINDNAQYLSKTIDDFRNFIKNERVYSKFTLKQSVDKFLSLVEPSFKRHNIELVLSLDSALEVNGYPNELLQCFMNIFNNAKDELKKSSHEKRYIFIDSFIEEENIVISFKDNGGGIDEDILPHIFEPYFTTKHQSQGTGLGLSMTYNLVVEGMNGTLTAHNTSFNYQGELYKGAEFIIKLPSS